MDVYGSGPDAAEIEKMVEELNGKRQKASLGTAAFRCGLEEVL